MSKKITFNALYKIGDDGNRVNIPALQGIYSDTAIKSDISALKTKVNKINNATSSPQSAGKVWATTSTGAGWTDVSTGEFANTSVTIQQTVSTTTIHLTNPAKEVYVGIEAKAGSKGNIAVDYKNDSSTVNTMTVYNAVSTTTTICYTHYKKLGDVYVSEKINTGNSIDSVVSMYTYPIRTGADTITDICITSSTTLPAGTKINIAYM